MADEIKKNPSGVTSSPEPRILQETILPAPGTQVSVPGASGVPMVTSAAPVPVPVSKSNTLPSFVPLNLATSLQQRLNDVMALATKLMTPAVPVVASPTPAPVVAPSVPPVQTVSVPAKEENVVVPEPALPPVTESPMSIPVPSATIVAQPAQIEPPPPELELEAPHEMLLEMAHETQPVQVKPIAAPVPPLVPPLSPEPMNLAIKDEPVVALAQPVAHEEPVPPVVLPQSTPVVAPMPEVIVEPVVIKESAPEPESHAPSHASPIPSYAIPGETPKAQLEHLLHDVKIPERREVPGAPSAVHEMAVFDTRLGAKPAAKSGIGMSPISVMPSGTDALRVQDSSGEQSGMQATPEDLKERPSVVPLHTLKDDLQEAIRVQKMSLIRAAAIEQDSKRVEKKVELRKEPTHSGHGFRTFMISLFVLLLILAAVGGGYMYLQQMSTATPINTGIVFTETTVSLPVQNLTSFELKHTLFQIRDNPSAGGGSITRIVPTIEVGDTSAASGQKAAVRPVTLEEFMKALGVHASPDLSRALGTDFMFGINSVDSNAPVFVIPVTSYERAFAGMLAWEPTMNADLQPVFTGVPDQVIGADGLPQKRNFTDTVIQNYDVRALKDDNGVIKLYYSFPSQGILVIGESQFSFTEVLSRLRAARKL